MNTLSTVEEQDGTAQILLDLRGGIATFTLNRPEERNPLGVDFTPRMMSILDRLEADSNCSVIVLTGSG